MSDILPLFLHNPSLGRQIRREGRYTRRSLTYPAVPIVPNVGHSDIKANTESKGPSKDGGHVDTYELRVE
jgi:hypothetical protein